MFTIDYQEYNSLEHAIRNALSYDNLHIPSSSGASEHAVRNGAWQRCEGGKVGVRMNGVKVPGDL